MTQPAEDTTPNPFFEQAPGTGLGAYVVDPYGRRGRIYAVHYGCPESAEWLDAQVLPLEGQSTKRWVSVLVHEGGSVVFPETMVTPCDAFVLSNASALFYFGEGTR